METPSISEFERSALSASERSAVRQLFQFLWQAKKWWMIPIVVTLFLLGVLIFLSSSAAAPFIYSLF
jgi:hypothetical protein